VTVINNPPQHMIEHAPMPRPQARVWKAGEINDALRKAGISDAHVSFDFRLQAFRITAHSGTTTITKSCPSDISLADLSALADEIRQGLA
jgi:hypothetical protein